MDAPVAFLVNYLEKLILHHKDYVAGAEKELEGVVEELKSLQPDLKNGPAARFKEDQLRDLMRWMWEVAYDVEDSMDSCITQMMAHRKRSSISRVFKPNTLTLVETVHTIKRKVQSLTEKIKMDFITRLSIADQVDRSGDIARKIRQQKSEHIVGFDKETEEIVNSILGESKELKIASIVGMAGIGKSTLAWNVYEHPSIQFEFRIRIWLNISDVLDMEKVLVDILKHFTSEVQKEPVNEMMLRVQKHLKDERFLIIMDDIWMVEAWNTIKEILPTENKYGRVLVTTRHMDVGKYSRVLVTTRHMDVGKYSSTTPPHCLRFLTSRESWELLQYRVFGKLGVVSPELVGIGKVIATDCKGLPLSLVIIGGILEEKNSRAGGDAMLEKQQWIEVSKGLEEYLVAGDENKVLTRIISLSYEKLPHELRNCFLYLGVFPEDAAIPVKKLIRLWISEGFINQRRGLSLELNALGCLKDLINRNLVMVTKATVDGEPKICHIHDSVRLVCKAECSYLNLFREIRKSYGEVFEPGHNIERIRRLSIHSYVLDFISTKPNIQKASSFLCFHESPMNLRPTDVISFTKGFNMLRVYDAENIKFPKIPLILVQILYLRYLTLAVDQCTSLPELIAELGNLQTLIVYVSSRTLDMKADIWKMRQLRHLQTKASITLRKDGQDIGGENLQTLGRLSPESCTRQFSQRAKNLVTLGVQGDLNKLTDPEFLVSLVLLNKLKLVNEPAGGSPAEYPLHRLPPPEKFPPNLKILVLTSTYLDWKNMHTLSMHGSLEELKLKENAFRGPSWEDDGTGFRMLKSLHIERMTELVCWTATSSSFPELRFLMLNGCEKLIEVPQIPYNNLKRMSLERVTKDVVISAEAIWKHEKEGRNPFKLEIAPGDKI